MKNLFLIILLFSFKIIFAQSLLTDSIYITKQNFTIKSKNTLYNYENLFCSFFCWNKYIKIPVKGIPSNINFDDKVTLIITNYSSNQIKMTNLSRGNKLLGNEKKRNKKKKYIIIQSIKKEKLYYYKTTYKIFYFG